MSTKQTIDAERLRSFLKDEMADVESFRRKARDIHEQEYLHGQKQVLLSIFQWVVREERELRL